MDPPLLKFWFLFSQLLINLKVWNLVYMENDVETTQISILVMIKL